MTPRWNGPEPTLHVLACSCLNGPGGRVPKSRLLPIRALINRRRLLIGEGFWYVDGMTSANLFRADKQRITA